MTPSGWRSGASLAVSVSVMLEGWSEDAAPGIGPMGNPLKAGVLDLQGRSWAAYGAETGVWRILDILAEAKVRAVFYTSGVLAAQYPKVLKAIVQAGHEIAAHGWSQDVIPPYQTIDQETHDLARSAEAIALGGGRSPRGYISPRCTPSAQTAALLARTGYLWSADYFDHDVPRVVELAEGRLVAVPFTMEVNDMPISVRYGNEPAGYVSVFERLLKGFPRLAKRAACIDLTVHAHVYGRPAGALAFLETLELARRHEAFAWLTHHAELAELATR